MRRWSRKLPDVIVVTNGEPSPHLSARISAAAKNTRLQNIAMLGSGIGLGLAIAGPVLSNGASITANSTAAQFGGTAATQAASNVASGIAGAPLPAQVGAGALAVVAVGGGVLLAQPDAEATAFAYSVGETITDGSIGPGSGVIESPGAADVYTFDLDNGGRYFVDWQDCYAVNEPHFTIVNPAGETVIDNPCWDEFVELEPGTHTWTIASNNDQSGPYSVQLTLAE
jgi:hypothetical protein